MTNKYADFSFDVVMRLAKIKNGRIWLNPKLKVTSGEGFCVTCKCSRICGRKVFQEARQSVRRGRLSIGA